MPLQNMVVSSCLERALPPPTQISCSGALGSVMVKDSFSVAFFGIILASKYILIPIFPPGRGSPILNILPL